MLNACLALSSMLGMLPRCLLDLEASVRNGGSSVKDVSIEHQSVVPKSVTVLVGVYPGRPCLLSSDVSYCAGDKVLPIQTVNSNGFAGSSNRLLSIQTAVLSIQTAMLSI